MGGMLATGALSMQTALAPSVRSITMVGSGCYGAGSWYSLLKPLVLAICLFGFPGDAAGAAIGKLAGTWASLAVAEAMFYWRSNTEVRARAPAAGAGAGMAGAWQGPRRARRSAGRAAGGAFARGAGAWSKRAPTADRSRCRARRRGARGGVAVAPSARRRRSRLPTPSPPPRPPLQVEAARKLMGTCFRYIPRGLIFQFLDSIVTPSGLATADRRMLYCDPAVLRCLPTPVLGLTGDWDLFCPAAGGLKTVQAFGSGGGAGGGGGGTRRFVELGPKHGAAGGRAGGRRGRGGRARALRRWSAAGLPTGAGRGGAGARGDPPQSSSKRLTPSRAQNKSPPNPQIPKPPKPLTPTPHPHNHPDHPPPQNQAPPRTTTATLTS
jgi:hypothetical protein